LPTCEDELVVSEDEYNGTGARVRNYPTNPNASFSTYWGGSFASAASGYSGYDRSMWGGQRPDMMESIASSYASGGSGYSSYQSGYSSSSRRSRYSRYEDDEEWYDRCSIM